MNIDKLIWSLLSHKTQYIVGFQPCVVLSLPPVVVGLASVLFDDSTVLWTVVWALSYVLSVIVDVVISEVRNTQLLFEKSFF